MSMSMVSEELSALWRVYFRAEWMTPFDVDFSYRLCLNINFKTAPCSDALYLGREFARSIIRLVLYGVVMFGMEVEKAVFNCF